MEVQQLEGQKIVMAVSGGLDSCTITHWLSRNRVHVVAFTADLGQPDERDIEDVRQRMLACGAKEMVVADLRDALCRAGLQLIQAGARYEGGYWNTTGIARHVVVEGMVPELRRRGITTMGHGATGRGNDQVRFQLATQMLAPEIKVYAPWRDQAFLSQFGGRKQMIDYCLAHSLPITASHEKPYSTDANMLGLTHEAGELESLSTPAGRIVPGMGVLPAAASAAPEVFTVRFEGGQAVAINGQPVDAQAAIALSNQIAGRHGVGIGLHTVENRFVGIKSRGVYEAPGMELLGACYGYLLQLVLDRRARRLYEPISAFIAEQVYQGYWFDTASQAAWKLIEHLSRLATGTIAVELCRGTVSFHSATDVPHSLYSADTASMEAVGEFDHRDSEGFLAVLGMGARALSTSGQVRR